MHRSCAIAVALVVVVTAVPARAAHDRKSAPAAVLDAFHTSYPKAKLKHIKPEKRGNERVYELESVDDGHERDIIYRSDGKALEIEDTIATGDVPAAVVAAVTQRFPRAKLKHAEHIAAYKPDDATAAPVVTYELVVVAKHRTHELVVSESGEILKAD